MSTGNKYVDAMGEISFEGNILPIEWFKHVRIKKSGTADYIAILLLSEIVYWYRPKVERSEDTGAIIRRSKKFKADLLQKTYRDLAHQFGLTMRQTENAITRLEKDYGLIQRVRRKAVKTERGIMGNVLFIQPNVDNIRAITHPNTPLVPSSVLGHTPQSRTYTETTTETTLGFTPTVPKDEGEGLDAASRPRHNMVDNGDDLLGEAEGEYHHPLSDNSEHPQSTQEPQDRTPELDSSDRLVPKRKRNSTAAAEEVLAYLNQVAQRNYRALGQIVVRMSQGVTVEECKLVIDYLSATRNDKWKRDWFDQDAPFRKGNFDKNLEKAKAWGATQSFPTPRSPATPREAVAMDDDFLAMINAAIPERSPRP